MSELPKPSDDQCQKLNYSLAGQTITFSFSHNTSLGGKSERVWYITVEQSVQATTAFARRLCPPREPQSKLTPASSHVRACGLRACGCRVSLLCRASLRVSVYFAVLEVYTNGEQKLSWPARIALR